MAFTILLRPTVASWGAERTRRIVRSILGTVKPELGERAGTLAEGMILKVRDTLATFATQPKALLGSAVVSATSDCGLPSSIHSDQTLSRKSRTWVSRVADDERNPYQNEWEDLIAAIRDDTPYNEVQYGIEASMLCNMGRMAAHTGREVSYDIVLEEVPYVR